MVDGKQGISMLEPIRPRKFEEADRAAVQDRAIAAVMADPEKLLAGYCADPRSFGGRYVNSDLMKEQFSDYAASPAARGRYDLAVHNPAAVLASEQFRRAIADTRDPSRTDAVFLTGMPGAGKSFAVQQPDGGIPTTARVLYEGQLSNPAQAIEKVGQAVAAGLKPEVIAILPDPVAAFERTMNRFNQVGRGAPIAALVNIHEGMPASLRALDAEFHDTLTITVHDVQTPGARKKLDFEAGITAWDKELQNGPLRQRLLNALDGLRNDPRFSDDFERQAHGQAPLAEHRSLERRGPESGEQGGQRPGVREEGGRSTLLRRSLFEAARGSTVGGLLTAVPAGRAAIPDGAEQVVVMNGSRLHESRQGGEWVVQKSDPQGMLPRGVFRLDTATPAGPDDGATYVGSILHVSAKGVYQVHGNGVARHDPSRFERVPSIGASPKITYANGRATIEGRGPDLPAKGRSI
jgi:hypothetical protein